MKKTSPSLDSFEETYKTAYSHGLESIYALENVDLKTVRPIQQRAKSPDPAPIENEVERRDLPSQFELDFGPSFRLWIPPLFLKEPVNSLNLSPRVVKILNELNVNSIDKLIRLDLHGLAFRNEMGQGHVDEVQTKVREFLRGRSIKESRVIEVGAWVRSLIGGLEEKKSGAFLQQFGLQDLVRLNVSSQMELRTADSNTQKEWIKEVYQTLKMGSTEELYATLSVIAQSMIIPWICSRGGIASFAEIRERLEGLADNIELFNRFMELLSHTFFEEAFPFDPYLATPEKNVYCANAAIAKEYQDAHNALRSYFYSSEVKYPLTHLIRMVSEEFGREWIGFPEGFLENILRYSPTFNLRKRKKAGLEVSLVSN